MLEKEKIKEFEDRLKQLKLEYSLDPIATLEFPQFKILPDEVLLALKIIEKYEYKIMLSYKEIEIENAN